MGEYIFLALIFIVILVFIKFYKKKNLEKNIESIEKIREFIEVIELNKKNYFKSSKAEELKEEYHSCYKVMRKRSKSFDKQTNELICSFIDIYEDLDNKICEYNEAFVNKELEECDELLSNIDGKSLDLQQRRAVVIDEDNNLIVAGAGSGKTLTISAKVKYLVERKKVKPSEILLISFTKKSASEMTNRISSKLDINVEANTFHKLGLDIITRYRGKRPDIVESLDKDIKAFFEKEIYSNDQILKNMVIYFGAYLTVPVENENINNLGELIGINKGINLSTLKGQFDINLYDDVVKELDEKHLKKENELRKIDPDNKDRVNKIQVELGKIEEQLKETKQTFKDEKVKSIEELLIANFLFLNGILYVYEDKYKYEVEDKFRKAYRPDFYLPEYDIYIEHFGITKDYKVPWLSKIEEEKYLDGIKWKRELHTKNNTKLVETYSYYNSEGVLLNKLKNKLKAEGVNFREVDYREVYEVVVKNAKNNMFNDFKKLVSTFISLYKSRGFDDKYFDELNKTAEKNTNPFEKNRSKLFFSIVKPIYVSYQDNLIKSNSIDFNDMIIDASQIVKEGNFKRNYKYIIIDEYQDISESRYKLVKAIRDKCKSTVMCVGDDWQSIYRFSGSDVNLFTNFEKYFGKTEFTQIVKTYRNSQELIDITGNFVMKNDKQIKKMLSSPKKCYNPVEVNRYSDSSQKNIITVLEEVIENIIYNYGEFASITILGRNNADIDRFIINNPNNKGAFKKFKADEHVFIRCNRYQDARIKYMTVHKSKGLEDDNIILINLENNNFGFPNQVSDDPILKYVLVAEEGYLFAEERRLFYVALTRTKNKVYLLAPQINASIFCEEIIKSKSGNIREKNINSKEENSVKCLKCNSGYLLKRKSGEREFIGCSNYPQCDVTYNNVDVVENKIICNDCGSYMTRRNGERGDFYGCTSYPFCKNTLSIKRTKKVL